MDPCIFMHLLMCSGKNISPLCESVSVSAKTFFVYRALSHFLIIIRGKKRRKKLLLHIKPPHIRYPVKWDESYFPDLLFCASIFYLALSRSAVQ